MGRRPGRKSGTKEKTIKYFDYTLLFVIIFLVCFGLVMLYSTSSYNAQIEYGDGTHYLKRQAFACCLGFAAMFVISKIDYHVWKRLYGVAYIGAFLLCVSVIFLGSNGNGSTRWFRLGPLSFQPSEFAKLAVVIFLATVISRMQKKIGNLKELMKVMVLLLPLVGPVAYTNYRDYHCGSRSGNGVRGKPEICAVCGNGNRSIRFRSSLYCTGKLSCRTYQNLAPSGEL